MGKAKVSSEIASIRERYDAPLDPDTYILFGDGESFLMLPGWEFGSILRVSSEDIIVALRRIDSFFDKWFEWLKKRVPVYFQLMKKNPATNQIDCTNFDLYLAEWSGKFEQCGSDVYVLTFDAKWLGNEFQKAPKTKSKMRGLSKILKSINDSAEDKRVVGQTSFDVDSISRPKGKRPQRLDKTNDEHVQWLDYEMFLYRISKGSEFGARRAFKKYSEILFENRLANEEEYVAIHKRMRRGEKK